MQLQEVICSRIRQLRELRSMSRADFARAIDCDYGNYCRYEKGDRQVPFELLESISSYCGVTIDFLFGRETVHESVLSDSETRLIEYFRRIPPSTQDDLLVFLRARAAQRQD